MYVFETKLYLQSNFVMDCAFLLNKLDFYVEVRLHY